MLNLDSLQSKKFEFRVDGKSYFIPSGVPNHIIKKMSELAGIKKVEDQLKAMTAFLVSIISLENGGPKAKKIVTKLDSEQILALATGYANFIREVYGSKKKNNPIKKKKKR